MYQDLYYTRSNLPRNIALPSPFLKLALKYVTENVKVNEEGLKLYRTETAYYSLMRALV